ncbi:MULTISPECIES: diacylglycerol/lipid kinase family protein [unclassified Nocardioides]|uniref:diacylglycerol/lipid kinase family protein n=1 Tax=unclassified Nocardioides TaxID=2615069 RepID=UPI0006F64DB7|nr:MULTISPECIES: diacylglycerol kinase family protein [unclassified Nocardioides]KQY57713.1 diacylglycerol kinase [Nocardioides sp. Root140]KQZ67645.1 diacylglycerol kinase [Nocardioides sp. Root151]KRF13246.1 diacylglycerol kinase [Nocardioides sp. Soil796]
MDPLLVITNADAGSGDQDALETALEVLRARASVEVAATSNPGELDGVLHRAGSRRIVVAGGDGSMHAVVAALHRRNELAGTVIGLIPLGTGNDFARGNGLPVEPDEAARVVLTGTPTPTDLLVDEFGDIVVNNVHVGASAQAGRLGAGVKSVLGKVRIGPIGLGKLGYPIGALMAAVRPHVLHLKVEVDGVVVNDLDQQVLMVALGNGSDVGGGTSLNPDADPADGKVDVMVSRAVGRLDRIAYVAHLSRGEHEGRDDVVSLRGSQVTVAGDEFWASADGEIHGPERRRTWRVVPGAYSLLRPAKSLD